MGSRGFNIYIYIYPIDGCKLWEERIVPQSDIVHFENGPMSRCHTHEFVQSHIGERCFLLLPYKHLA